MVLLKGITSHIEVVPPPGQRIYARCGVQLLVTALHFPYRCDAYPTALSAVRGVFPSVYAPDRYS
jgi:hypothetical protein